MAAFAPAHSAEWLAFVAVPPRLVPTRKWGAKLRTSSASLTLTGAGVATATMLRLPSGDVRVYPDLCRIFVPDGATGAVVNVGYLAHTNVAGTAVVADEDAFMLNGAAGSGDLDSAFTLPAVGYLDLNSQEGVDITVKIHTANSPATGEIWIKVAYSQGN